MQASRAAEARNEYNPDDPFSKVFGKWLPPQVIVWGAVIVIIILVVLGIYYTIMASK
jgi:ABC-type antimicrobial peptide transport system permease subunit